MRDSQRIWAIASKLTTLWRMFPNLRLGQLIANLSPMDDIYYLEDEELLRLIERELADLTPLSSD